MCINKRIIKPEMEMKTMMAEWNKSRRIGSIYGVTNITSNEYERILN